MSGSVKSKNSVQSNNVKEATSQEVEVLYQKLGDQWYAFSMIDDDMFMAPVDEAQIQQIRREQNEAA